MSGGLYTPDAWVIVRITTAAGETIDKVMGGWYGGYLDADSWRLNSGITEVRDRGAWYEIVGHSGSVYKCGKRAERPTGLMAGIIESMAARAREDGGSVRVIPIGDL